MTLDPLLPLGLLLILISLGGLAIVLANRLNIVSQTVVAIVLHCVVAVAMYGRLGLWAPDAMLYDRAGEAMANAWFGGDAHSLQVTAGKEGFPYVLAVLYGTFGHYPLLGIAFNVMLTVLLVPVITATARRIGTDSQLCAWLAALFPSFLIWGSLLLREALSWLLIALVVFALTGITRRARDRVSMWDWPVLIVALTLFTFVRGTAAILVAAAAMLTVLWSARQKFWTITVGVLSLIIAAPTLASSYTRLAGNYDLKRLNTVRGALSRDAASSFSVGEIGSIPSMIRALPMSTMRGFLGPFPWEWPRVGAFAVAQGLVWLVTFALALYAWWKSGFSRNLVSMIAPTVSVVIVLALASGNYGTLLRLREQAAVCLLPLATMGIVKWRQHRHQKAALDRATVANRKAALRERARQAT